MTAVIVLGMHRSGTSLVASMLEAMGVDMGERLMPASLDNPHGYYEDLDFYEMNEAILEEAGGSWWQPPSQQAIDAAGEALKYPIGRLVNERDWKKLWGWKDPRTCLTAGLYHPHLDDARYVLVSRDSPDVVASLTRRNGTGDWQRLIQIYQHRLHTFFRATGAPVLRVRYEDLTHPKAAPKQALKLAKFIGLDRYAAARALDRIEYRNRWGFGSIGFGVPYFKPVSKWWLCWSWFLVGGWEGGDQFLNNKDIPMEARLPLAHNALIQRFLFKTDQDTLCIMEDDHGFPQDQLRRMRFKEENQEFDIVCASYTKRREGDIPLPMGWHIKEDESRRTATFNLDEIDDKGTQPYDGAALGFTLVRRWVLEEMLGNNDPDTFQWVACEGLASPDVPFYYRARDAGAKVGVDRDNKIVHYGMKAWTHKDWEACWARIQAGFEKEEATTNGRI